MFVGLATLGIVIGWGLPHGRHGFRGGRGPEEEVKLLWMNEHQLGEIHLWLGIIFIVLMLAHLVLHWKWIKCYIRSLFGTSEKHPCEETLSS